MIGDLQTAAMISRDGSVDWLCLPRFDSDAVFAAMLGDAHNGQWALRPAQAGATVTRGYAADSLILVTTWRTGSGTARVTDFMPPRDDAPPVLIRLVEGVEGVVELETVIRLRFGYGAVLPWVRRSGDAVWAVAGPDAVWLRTPARLVGRDMAHRASFTVAAGQAVPFTLTWTPSHLGPPEPVDAPVALEQAERFWAGWSSRCGYQGKYRDAVLRSLITLKGLSYAPTGGIVAAPTTSLPEDLGGERNWDYRYCWLRDATMVLEALLRTGYSEEAVAWERWLGRAVAGNPADVQIMYGVAGERRLPEWEAGWLRGYAGSAPVRIGNAAVLQRQLDVYGEVIDAFALGRQAGRALDRHLDRHSANLIIALLEFLERTWTEPDEGIWEVRGPRRQFVHSKVMAWVAFDRAIRLAESGWLGASLDAEPGAGLPARWRAVRDAIHAQVCDLGYDAVRGTFTQYYGSAELDAAVLLIPELGFLPAADARVVSTVRVLQRELVRDGLVLRYSLPGGAGPAPVDGLAGGEGAFLACSFWLVSALDLIGERRAAGQLFQRLLALRNDLGLLSEEYDQRYGRQVGNTPQAFSHVALINAALNLENHAPGHRRDAGRRQQAAGRRAAAPGDRRG